MASDFLNDRGSKKAVVAVAGKTVVKRARRARRVTTTNGSKSEWARLLRGKTPEQAFFLGYKTAQLNNE